MKQKAKATDYVYAVSRIRAVERSLLDINKLLQIADAKSADEAFRMVLDAGYPAAETYEQSFALALDEVYALLRKISPRSDFLDVFLIENDYYNLKVLLRAEFLGKNLDHLLNPRCLSGLDAIKAAVIERRGADISLEFDMAMREAIDCFSQSKNVQLADIAIDRWAFLSMKNRALQFENKFLTGLIELKVDLINIKTMFRLRKMGKDVSFAKKAMLPGGSLDIEMLASCVEDTREGVAARFSPSRYASLIEEHIDGLDGDTAAIIRLEIRCAEMLSRYIRTAKYVHFGPEPLVAYIFAKENEVKQLRIIMVGKTNRLDSEAIKERLNAGYV